MSFNFTLPNLTANTAEGKILQVQDYLYQMVQQLNWALNTLETGGSSSPGSLLVNGAEAKDNGEEALARFADIKALIIKSADIVEAYYDKMIQKFYGAYLADSDFGRYINNTEQTIETTSEAYTHFFSNFQQIISVIETDMQTVDTKAVIRTGLLDTENGVPVYGIEVGQKNTIDGVVTFNRFARFTAEGIYFYLPGAATPIAYMTGRKLFITDAQLTSSLQIGGYKLFTEHGITLRWIGENNNG